MNEQTIREIIALLRDNPQWIPWAVGGVSGAWTLHLLSKQQQQPSGMSVEDMMKLLVMSQQMQYRDIEREVLQDDDLESRLDRLENMLLKLIEEKK